jgi:hypothetical protein
LRPPETAHTQAQSQSRWAPAVPDFAARSIILIRAENGEFRDAVAIHIRQGQETHRREVRAKRDGANQIPAARILYVRCQGRGIVIAYQHRDVR